MRLRLGAFGFRVTWRTPAGLLLAVGLFGSGLAALIVLALGINAITVPACEAATPAPPDFEVAPFAFDPEARALAFGQAHVDHDYRRAYAMLAPEQFPVDSICELELESYRSLTGDRASVSLVTPQGFPLDGGTSVRDDVPPTSAIGFVAAYDGIEAFIRLVPRQPSAKTVTYLRITLLRDGRVSRVALLEPLIKLGPVEEFPPPPYADLKAFDEIDVVVGQAPWALGGTLTVPRGPGPFPAVVLVPGSKYPDRESTGGAVKPSRDVAWGLASEGVAVLRYDKRTLTHALAIARQPHFTLDDVLVDDALAAVALLRQTPRIDPTRVFVLGSSLGGFAAPRIAQRDPAIAGLIIESAPSGSFWDGLVQNALRRSQADGEVSELEQRQIDIVRTYVGTIEAHTDDGVPPPNMTVRPPYFQDLVGYQPEIVARDVPIPMLVLHGNLDGALTQADTTGWTESLRRRRNVAFRLNREHMHGLFDRRTVSGSDLRPAGHVSAKVVDDIAFWIGGGRPEQACVDIQAWFAGCRGGPEASFDGVARAS